MRSLFAPVLLCNLLVSWPCLGQIVRDYGYPIADPLEATVIGTPPEYQAAKFAFRVLDTETCVTRSRRGQVRRPLCSSSPVPARTSMRARV